MKNNKENSIIGDVSVQISQINFDELLNGLVQIIIYLVGANALLKAANLYVLRRQYKPKKISKVILPTELQANYSDVDEKRFCEDEYKDTILEFANVLQNNFPKEDLVNFYNNINELKSETKKKSLIFRRYLAGQYSSKKNKIIISEGEEENTIFHELFHMASTSTDGKKRLCGFHQVDLKRLFVIGKGLNEGYTELMTERYFGKSSYKTKAYAHAELLAEKVEKIVGKEKMEKLYLHSDLMGLIEELKQYASEDAIMRFIADTDFLVTHLSNRKREFTEKGKINKSLKNAGLFLMTTYGNKLIKEYGDNIPDEELTEFGRFIGPLFHVVIAAGHLYEGLTIDDVKDYIAELKSKYGINDTLERNTLPF